MNGQIVDYYEIHGAGPRGGSSYRFGQFLDRWRADALDGRVRILCANDYSHVIVVETGRRRARRRISP